MSVNDSLIEFKSLLDGALEAKTVELYAGRFSTESIMRKSFSSPAVFLTCLGWSPISDQRVSNKTGAGVRYAAFVLTKQAKGNVERMTSAIDLCELITRILNKSQYKTTALRCENLFSETVDKKYLSLWAVTWTVPTDFSPNPDDIQALNDLICVEQETNEKRTNDSEMTTTIQPLNP